MQLCSKNKPTPGKNKIYSKDNGAEVDGIK